jgi:hypothetical protein
MFSSRCTTPLLIIFSLFISLFLAPCPKVFAAEIALGLPDEELLDKIQRQSFDYFAFEKNPENGLVRDRADNFKKGAKSAPASIAASGFALAVYAIAVSRNWIDYASAREITVRTLQFFLNQAPEEHGFFYHYLDIATGKRSARSELSPIDTALFLAGALFAAEYYEDSEIRELANKIYERVDWNWMLHGGKTLALAWSPESGFNKHRWDHYDESMILYLLAIGSPTHPIPAENWKEISRPVGSYKNLRVIQSSPLFTHQYSHAWIDFKNKNDGYADYFQNSVNATLANRQFVMDLASKRAGYGENSWGLTASDSPAGYQAFGAPPGWAKENGTLAPTACGNSIVFTPELSIACMRHMYEEQGDKLWGQYGFSNAFNLDRNWFSTDVIAIDQGALILMIENHRTSLVWNAMNQNMALQNAMKAVGFKEGTKELPWPEPPSYQAYYAFGSIDVDGYANDWKNGPSIHLDRAHLESGNLKNEKDVTAELRFAWDENALYFHIEVKDDEVVLTRSGKNIWQDDLLEIFIDPKGDGLYWNGQNDYQLGFRPERELGGVLIWSWFQGGQDLTASARTSARCFVDPDGYTIEGAIDWNDLNMRPTPGMTLRLSPAVHDVDKDRNQAKLQWFFRNEEELQRFVLGKIILEPKNQISPTPANEETVQP